MSMYEELMEELSSVKKSVERAGDYKFCLVMEVYQLGLIVGQAIESGMNRDEFSNLLKKCSKVKMLAMDRIRG